MLSSGYPANVWNGLPVFLPSNISRCVSPGKSPDSVNFRRKKLELRQTSSWIKSSPIMWSCLLCEVVALNPYCISISVRFTAHNNEAALSTSLIEMPKLRSQEQRYHLKSMRNETAKDLISPGFTLGLWFFEEFSVLCQRIPDPLNLRRGKTPIMWSRLSENCCNSY